MPGKSHGWRNLVGYSPWGRKELDMTERLHFHFLSQVIGRNPNGSDLKESACNAGDQGLIPWLGRFSGEGSGYPFQYSYLENPMERGAWRAAAHGVTKSWTLLSD